MEQQVSEDDKKQEPRISTLPTGKNGWRVKAGFAALFTVLFVIGLFAKPGGGVLLQIAEFVIVARGTWFFDGFYKRLTLPRQMPNGEPDPWQKTRRITRNVVSVALLLLVLIIVVQTWSTPSIVDGLLKGLLAGLWAREAWDEKRTL